MNILKMIKVFLRSRKGKYLMRFSLIGICTPLFIGEDNFISDLGFILLCLAFVIAISRIYFSFEDEYREWQDNLKDNQSAEED